jgi:hypothetical protein
MTDRACRSLHYRANELKHRYGENVRLGEYLNNADK